MHGSSDKERERGMACRWRSGGGAEDEAKERGNAVSGAASQGESGVAVSFMNGLGEGSIWVWC